MLQKLEISGPIVVIDNDEDDLDLIKDALKSLHLENEIIGFLNSAEAAKYVETTNVRPFLIFCEINMPVMNGFDLGRRLFKNEVNRAKAIPFLFLSHSSNQDDIDTAYEVAAQGYFTKPPSIHELRKLLKGIINFWKVAIRPPFKRW